MAEVAWKRLNLTDYKNIRGEFAGGGGGGATYIVLGTGRHGQDFGNFFPQLINNRCEVQSAEGVFTVSSDPGRRKGEWLIIDQRGHRHPAWSAATNFPEELQVDDPAVVLIFKEGGDYSTEWLLLSEFAKLAPTLADNIRGVDTAPETLRAHFMQDNFSTLADFTAHEADFPEQSFDPADQEDGRKRILAEIVRRQGQQGFRKKLMTAYSGKCAVTGCGEPWVVEAAHISPYRGPETNRADNGLLLRADIHTLFDLGLLSINPDTLLVRVAQQIQDPEYRALEGAALIVGTVAPSQPALKEHWDRATA